MTDGTVTAFPQLRIIDATRQAPLPCGDRNKQALQLAYFLSIIETMLSEGTPQQVAMDDVIEFISLARQKADALCENLMT